MGGSGFVIHPPICAVMGGQESLSDIACDSCSEFRFRWNTSEALIGWVDPTAEAERGVGIKEGIHTVYQNSGGTNESQLFGSLLRVDVDELNLSTPPGIGQKRIEYHQRLFMVWASIEIKK